MFNLYTIILFLGSLVGIGTFRKQDPGSRVLSLLLIYTFIHEIIVHQFSDWGINAGLYITYAGISTGLFLFALALNCINPLKRKILSMMAPLIGSSGLFTQFVFDQVVFPSKYLVITIPFIVIACLMLFFDLLQKEQSLPLKKNPVFISTVAIFIYQCLVFTHLGVQSYIIENEVIRSIDDDAHRLISILFYATLGYSFLLSRWNSKNVTSTA